MDKKILCPERVTAKGSATRRYSRLLKMAGGDDNLAHYAFIKNGSKYDGLSEASVQALKYEGAEPAGDPAKIPEAIAAAEQKIPGAPAEHAIPESNGPVLAKVNQQAIQNVLDRAKAARGDQPKATFSALPNEDIEKASVKVTQYRTYLRLFQRPGDNEEQKVERVLFGLHRYRAFSEDMSLKFVADALDADRVLTAHATRERLAPDMTQAEAMPLMREAGMLTADDLELPPSKDSSFDGAAAMIKSVEGNPLVRGFVEMSGAQNPADVATKLRISGLLLERAHPEVGAGSFERQILNGDLRALSTPAKIFEWANSPLPSEHGDDLVRTFRAYVATLVVDRGNGGFDSSAAIRFLRSLGGYGVSSIMSVDEMRPGSITKPAVYEPATGVAPDSLKPGRYKGALALNVEKRASSSDHITMGLPTDAAEHLSDPRRLDAFIKFVEGPETLDPNGYQGVYQRDPVTGERVPLTTPAFNSNQFSQGNPHATAEYYRGEYAKLMQQSTEAEAAGNAEEAKKFRKQASMWAVALTPEAADSYLVNRLSTAMRYIFPGHDLHTWMRTGHVSILHSHQDGGNRGMYFANALFGSHTHRKGEAAARSITEASLFWNLYKLAKEHQASPKPDFREQVEKLVLGRLTNRRIGEDTPSKKGASSDRTAINNFLESGSGRLLALTHKTAGGKTRTSKYESQMDAVLKKITGPHFERKGVAPEDLELSQLTGLYPENRAVPMMSSIGGASTDEGLLGEVSYSRSGRETMIEILDQAAARYWADPWIGPHPDYASFPILMGEKGNYYATVPRGILNDAEGNPPKDYPAAWEKMKSLLDPYLAGIKPKYYGMFFGGGPTPAKIEGGLQDTFEIGVVIGQLDKPGGQVKDTGILLDGSIVGSPDQHDRHAISEGQRLGVYKNHGTFLPDTPSDSAVSPAAAVKGLTTFHHQLSIAPGSPAHQMQEKIFQKLPGLHYIMGSGTVKAADFMSDKALLAGLRGGKIDGLLNPEDHPHTYGFTDVDVGDGSHLRIVNMRIPLTWRGAANIESHADLRTQSPPRQLATDFQAMNPGPRGEAIAKASHVAMEAGLRMQAMAESEFGTKFSATEIADLLEDPSAKAIATRLATDYGLPAHMIPMLATDVIPRMTSRISEDAKVKTLGAHFAVRDSGMYIDADGKTTRSVTGKLDPLMTGYVDYFEANGEIRGAMARANLFDYRTPHGVFVRAKFSPAEFEALVVKHVMARRDKRHMEADGYLAELKAMWTHEHGAGGPVDDRTILDDMVDEKGKFRDSSRHQSPGISELAEAAGAKGSPYYTLSRIGSVDRVPGVVASSHNENMWLSAPVAWVKRTVTHKAVKYVPDEHGALKRTFVDVTEERYAPAESNEISVHPEIIKTSGQDYDGDTLYISTWERGEDGRRVTLPESMMKGDTVGNIWKLARKEIDRSIRSDPERFGAGDPRKLTDSQRSERRELAEREINKYRRTLGNHLLSSIHESVADEMKGIQDPAAPSKIHPEIDVKALYKLFSMPMVDEPLRAEFAKDPESVALWRKAWADHHGAGGLPFDESLLSPDVTPGRSWQVPPIVLLETKLGPLGKRGGHEGALRKEVADKYSAQVRGFFGALARVVSNGTVAGGAYDVGRPRMVLNRKTGTYFAANEKGISGDSRKGTLAHLPEGALWGSDFEKPDFGRTGSDGNYTAKEKLESLGHVVRWIADNLNAVIDAMKSDYPDVVSFRLTPEFVGPEIALMLGENFKSYEDANKFHARYMAWANTGIGQAVRTSATEIDLPFKEPLRRTISWGYGKRLQPAGRLLFSQRDRTFERVFRAAVELDPRAPKLAQLTFEDGTTRRQTEDEWLQSVSQAIDEKGRRGVGRDILRRAHDVASRYEQLASVYQEFSGLDRLLANVKDAPHTVNDLIAAQESVFKKFKTVTFTNGGFVRRARGLASLTLSRAEAIHQFNPLYRDHEGGNFGGQFMIQMQEAASRNATSGDMRSRGAPVPTDTYGSDAYALSYMTAAAAASGLSPRVRAVVEGSTADDLMWLTHAVMEKIYQDKRAAGESNPFVSAFVMPADPKLGQTGAYRRLGVDKGDEILPEHYDNIYAGAMNLPDVVVNPGDMHVPDHVKEGIAVSAEDARHLLAAYSAAMYGARLSGQYGGFLSLLPPRLIADISRRTLGFAMVHSRGEAAKVLANRFIGEPLGSQVSRSWQSEQLRQRYNRNVYNVPLMELDSFIPLQDSHIAAIEAEKEMRDEAAVGAPDAAVKPQDEAPAVVADMRTILDVEGNRIQESADPKTLIAMKGLLDFAKVLDPSIYPDGKVTAAVRAAIWSITGATAKGADAKLAQMAVDELNAEKAAGLSYNPVKGEKLRASLLKAIGADTAAALAEQHPWFTRMVGEVASFSSQRLDKMLGTELPKWVEWVDKNVETGEGQEEVAAAPEEKVASKAPITFEQAKTSNYQDRTRANAAAADVTIDFSRTPIGSGGARGLTRIATFEAGKLYINVPVAKDGTFSPQEAASKILEDLGKGVAKQAELKKALALNIAGHGLGEMGTQQDKLDGLVRETLRLVQEGLAGKGGPTVGSIRSGGQTGYDESGAKAGAALGLPTTVLAPGGWRFRTGAGTATDVYDEAKFKSRFDNVEAEPAIEKPGAESKLPEEYKGIPVFVRDGMIHPIHEQPHAVRLVRPSDGPPRIEIDPKEVQKTFDEKRWTAPREKGVAPLPEHIFTTPQDLVEFMLEHEHQHSLRDMVRSTDPGHAARENEINEAALKELGIERGRITGAAVQIDGELLEGVDHAAAILRKHPEMTAEQIEKIRVGDEAGFAVRQGNETYWESRKNAAILASQNGQLKSEFANVKELHSHMISFSALADFSENEKIRGDKVISPLAFARLPPRMTWDNLTNLTAYKLGYTQAERESADSKWLPVIDHVRNAPSYQEAKARIIARDQSQTWPRRELRAVAELAKYMPPREWIEAMREEARVDRDHPYNKWMELKQKMRGLLEHPEAEEALYQELGGDRKLVTFVDRAWHELILREPGFEGSGDRLIALLGRHMPAVQELLPLDIPIREPEAFSALASTPPEDSLVESASPGLLDLMRGDPKLARHIGNDDAQPQVVSPKKYARDPKREAAQAARAKAGEPESLQPYGGRAPEISFSALAEPLEAKRDEDANVLSGWPKGEPPAWKVYRFSDPRDWMQAEIELSSRMIGENSRLESLQRFGYQAGVHKARTDRLCNRLDMLFGLDLRGYIREMYQTSVPKIAGTEGEASLFASLDHEAEVAKTMREGEDVMIERGGKGWAFSLAGGVGIGRKAGRMKKPGTVDVYTPEERRDTELYLEALKGALQASPSIITALRVPMSRGVKGFQNDAMMAKMKRLLPVDTYNRIAEAMKTKSQAELLDSGILSWSRATDELALSLPTQDVLDGYAKTSAHAKLVKAGRDPEFLKPGYTIDTVRKFLDEERSEYNKHAPWFMTQEGDPVRYRKNYFPMEFGTGWYAKGVENLDELLQRDIDKTPDELALKNQQQYEEVLKSAGRIDRGEYITRPLSETSALMLQYLHDLLKNRYPEQMKNILWNGRKVFEAQIRSGGFEKMGIPASADFAEVARAINELNNQELFLRKMRDEDLSKPIGEIDPVAMARALQKQLRGMPQEEPTFSRRRAFNTHREAWETAGLLPAASGLTESLRRYGEKGMEQAARKMTLNNLLMSSDVDGRPLVLALPNLAYGDTHGVVEDAVWETAARQWAKYFEVPYDSGLTGKENAHRIVTDNVAGQSGSTMLDVATRKYNFVTVPTTYSSVSSWYGAMDRVGESNVMDLSQGGESAAILKQLMDSTKYSNVWRSLSVIEDANSWAKSIAMQFSLFHANTILEDILAGSAGKGVAPGFLRGKLGNWGANALSPAEIYRMMKTDSPYLAHLRSIMEEAGLTWCYGNNNAADIGTVGMSRRLGSVEKYVHENIGENAAKDFREVAEMLTSEQTSFVFEYLNNIGKISVAHNLMQGLRKEALAKGVPFDAAAALRPLSQVINEAVGPLNPLQYSWYTPQVRQFGNLALFSLQWTLGAWNAAGGSMLTGRFLESRMTPEARDFSFKRRLPWMVGLVLFAQPAMWQLATYLVAKAAGKTDDDDTPWMFNNEDNKKSYADVTPLARMMPWYKGDPTGKRRTYLRWGKQLHEIAGWLEDPWKTAAGKSSLALQTTWGMVTGRTLGTEWNLGFYNQGLMGWFDGKNGFADSRLWYLAQRAVPVLGTFSANNLVRNPDAGIAAFFSSTSQGTSYHTATVNAQEVLKAWALKDNYHLLMADSKKKADLHGLLADILDDASRNGYDPEKVLNASRAAVMKEIYAKFYKTLNDGDEERLIEVARELMRLNGTVEAARSSIRNRNMQYGKPVDLTLEQEKALEEAFREPEAKGRKEVHKLEQRAKHKKPTAASQMAQLSDYLDSLQKKQS